MGFGQDAEALIQALLDRTPEVIGQAQRDLPHGMPPKVVDTVLGGLERAAKTLAADV